MPEINQQNVRTTLTVDEYGEVSIYTSEGMNATDIMKDLIQIMEELQSYSVPYLQKLMQGRKTDDA